MEEKFIKKMKVEGNKQIEMLEMKIPVNQIKTTVDSIIK
jgi:hypothetical protein